MKIITLILICFFTVLAKAQIISGKLTQITNQPIKLEGFNGLNTYPISNGKTDENGNFKLSYSKTDYGMGYLMTTDEKPLFVMLSGENIEIIGAALSNTETLNIIKGQQNILFEQYAKEHPKREQALSAWKYLEKIYKADPLFAKQTIPILAIIKEKKRINEQEAAFLGSLQKDSYVAWFLPTRKLISSVSTIAQYSTEEIPATIAAFRTMDYTDNRLYKSGLLKDAIDNHFWLLENCGKPLDSVAVEMKISVDAMLQNLLKDEKKLNIVTDHLFKLLEQHSLFEAAAYLAVRVLNNGLCTIDTNLAKQLETYRVMKKGNIAPDIEFLVEVVAPDVAENNIPKKLSNINSKYILVVFGASWCPKCTEEIPEIVAFYPTWKLKGLEVVFVSLDENKEAFKKFTAPFPFISTCDYQKWNGIAAKDYYVFGTPSMYLLNEKREILARPNSVGHVNALIDHYFK